MAEDRIQKNSDDTRTHTWDAEQRAILNSQLQGEKADRVAANQAFQAASHRPATNGERNPGIQGTFTPFPQSLMPPKEPKAPKGGKKGR